MSTQSKHLPLPGSHRDAMTGSTPICAAHPHERIVVTVRIRSASAISPTVKLDATSASPPHKRRYLTREQLATDHGASADDIAKVVAFAHAHQLAVVETSAARRSVWLAGTVEQMSTAFGVTLEEYDCPHGGTFRGRTGSISIPADLHGIVVGVFGLDNRPQARPHFRLRRTGKGQPVPHATVGSSQFTPTQIAELYNFPANLDGAGECIGLIELGGGFKTADLKAYFNSLGLPVPTVSSVSVDKGSNTPSGSADGPDGEVMLDIEVAAAVAPKAKIVVYFTANTSQGFLDAITQAIHDTVNKPSVISISWGGPESNWTDQAFEQFDEAFQAAATLGVTITVAAGDDGSSDGVNDGSAHADFPASSPNVLACGGTSLNASDSAITSEVVWNDGDGGGATGGGISDQFPVPSYQSSANIPPSANSDKRIGRGLPDVAADADPATGYSVRVDGQDTVVGGTSAVAPLWAGLIARLNQSLGKPVGFLNPFLYSLAPNSGVFRDIESGNNGAYSAGPGWDPCSGLGAVDGTKLLEALSS
jgi:kumamolisin